MTKKTKNDQKMPCYLHNMIDLSLCFDRISLCETIHLIIIDEYLGPNGIVGNTYLVQSKRLNSKYFVKLSFSVDKPSKNKPYNSIIVDDLHLMTRTADYRSLSLNAQFHL